MEVYSNLLTNAQCVIEYYFLMKIKANFLIHNSPPNIRMMFKKLKKSNYFILFYFM